MSRAFLGTGWKFPLNVDEQGSVVLVSEDESVAESIWIILSTARGERLMHPEFGCGIHELVFEPNNESTAGLAQFYVQDALSRWEPRILIDEVAVTSDLTAPSLLLISVTYRVRATDSRFNFVYPFYLTRGLVE